ncbi:MAG: hypothetical protein QF561_07035 [Phycisphaerales bacterium]|nr:hypothetical protein [Phycisphaerales bacterium]
MRRIACTISVLACALWVRAAAASAPSSYVDLSDSLVGEYEHQAPQAGGISPLFGMAVSAILVAAIIAASLIPSKRGHQD